MDAVLLLLADGRFPAGGHAHSGGLEVAVAQGQVRCLSTLESFLIGRLYTIGLVAAAFAAAAVHSTDRQRLDDELEARIASPVARLASRRQGRALLRAGNRIWAISDMPPHRDGPHLPLALGVVAAAAGLSETQAAQLAVHHQVTGQASAALRLLGSDPYAIQALLIRVAPQCDAVAATAAAFAGKNPAELPMHSSPLADIAAETHATWEVRLFAS